MPGFDGTGPNGQGPMTGRGEGYCAIPLDQSGGVAGVQQRPLVRRRWTSWFRPRTWFRRPFFGRGLDRGGRRGFNRGAGRGRGRGRW